jgi:hypothetical protein
MDQLPENAPRTLSGRIAALSFITCVFVSLLVATGLFASMTLGSSTPLCADAVVSGNLAFTAGGISLVILSSLVLYTLVAICGSFLCLRATEVTLGLSLSLRDEPDEQQAADNSHSQGGSASRHPDTGAASPHGAAAAATSAADDSTRLLSDIETGGESAAAGASHDAAGISSDASDAAAADSAAAGPDSADAAEDSEQGSGDDAVDAAVFMASIPIAPVVARPDEAKTVNTLQRLLVSHSCVALVFTIFFVVHGFSTVYRYADPVQMQKLDSCNGVVRTVTEIFLWVQMSVFILVALFFCCLLPCAICLAFVLSAVLDGSSSSFLNLSAAPPSTRQREAQAGATGASAAAPDGHEAASSSQHSSSFDALGSTAGIDEHTANLTRRLAAGGALAPPRGTAAGAPRSAPTVLPPI